MRHIQKRKKNPGLVPLWKPASFLVDLPVFIVNYNACVIQISTYKSLFIECYTFIFIYIQTYIKNYLSKI